MGVLHLVSLRELSGCCLDGVAQFSLVFVWLSGSVFRRSGIVSTGSLGLVFTVVFCLDVGAFRDALYSL